MRVRLYLWGFMGLGCAPPNPAGPLQSDTSEPSADTHPSTEPTSTACVALPSGPCSWPSSCGGAQGGPGDLVVDGCDLTFDWGSAPNRSALPTVAVVDGDSVVFLDGEEQATNCAGTITGDMTAGFTIGGACDGCTFEITINPP